jgi:hypothetical protein
VRLCTTGRKQRLDLVNYWPEVWIKWKLTCDETGRVNRARTQLEGGFQVMEATNVLQGVILSSLKPGSVIHLDTRNHHYRIEYLGGDKAQISGHPRLCPNPVEAEVQGSIGNSIEAGSIRQGMHLVFRPLDRADAVTTSEITSLRVAVPSER